MVEELVAVLQVRKSPIVRIVQEGDIYMGIYRLEQGGYRLHGRAGWVSWSSREQQFTQL